MIERAQRFLTLSLNGEKYAITVGRVREILEYAPVTRLPSDAAFFKGLINVRGRRVAGRQVRDPGHRRTW